MLVLLMLYPVAQDASVTRINIIGAGAVVGLYTVCLLAFALYSNWPLAR